MTALYYPTKWLSKIIMKIIMTEIKIKFCNLEKISLKYSASKAHRQFNNTCIYIFNNTLLMFIFYMNSYAFIPRRYILQAGKHAIGVENFFMEFVACIKLLLHGRSNASQSLRRWSVER